MKASVALMLVSFFFFAAVAYGRAEVSAGVAAVVSHSARPGEPVALLISGSVLLGLAGALRRFNL